MKSFPREDKTEGIITPGTDRWEHVAFAVAPTDLIQSKFGSGMMVTQMVLVARVSERAVLVTTYQLHTLVGGRVQAVVLGILSLVGFLVVSACESHPPSSVNRDITFTHLKPYLLNVASLEIVNAYKTPYEDPYVEHLVPISPSTAARQWATHLLHPVGKEGVVRVTISDAQIILEALGVNQDFKSLFTTEQAARYHARIEITIDILDERHISRAYASGVATTSNTVSEGASLAERDEILIELTETLLDTFNTAIAPQIEQFLAPYLR